MAQIRAVFESTILVWVQVVDSILRARENLGIFNLPQNHSSRTQVFGSSLSKTTKILQVVKAPFESLTIYNHENSNSILCLLVTCAASTVQILTVALYRPGQVFQIPPPNYFAPNCSNSFALTLSYQYLFTFTRLWDSRK